MELEANRFELVQKFVEFFATNAPDPPHWNLNSRFGVFRTIWDHLVSLPNSEQNNPNLCKSSCHEVASEFCATNAPDPPHWTLNSCFVVFCTIWVHSALFACLMKLGAKRTELVQKFVPRSRVEIFRNEHTPSTPLDSKLMFWCIS